MAGLIPGKTQNNIITQYNFKSIFAEAGFLNPAYVGFYVKDDEVEGINFGEPLMWKDAVVVDGIITGGYVTPLKASTVDAGVTWTLDGQLATISLGANGIGDNNMGEVRGVVMGTLISKFIDLSKVSTTVGVDFKLSDLLKIVNLNGSLLTANMASGDFLLNVLGIDSAVVS